MCLVLSLHCPSNHIYMQSSSCAGRRQLCQYICLIQTCCNWQCDQKYCYACISPYWHIPLNKYACPIPYTCLTALLVKYTYKLHIYCIYKPIRSKMQLLFTMVLQYMWQQQMSLKYHICKIAHVQIGENYVSIYGSYDLSAITSVTWVTGLHIFHITVTCALKYACHVTYICHTGLLL